MLKELVAELHFVPGGLPPSAFGGLVRGLAEVGYTEIELLNAIAHAPAGASLTPRARCWTAERTRCVQFSTDFAAINYADVYPGKQMFLDAIAELVPIVRGASRGAIRELVLVTVDELQRPAGYELGEYFACEGRLLPTELATAKDEASASLHWGTSRSRRGYQLTMVSTPEGRTDVLLQFFLRERDPAPELLGVVTELLDEASGLFRRVITPKTEDEIMGGKI